MDGQRRESEVLPTHENYDDEDRHGTEELTARKMLSADRTADLTGRSDIRPYDDDENWMNSLKGGSNQGGAEEGGEDE